MNPIQTRSFRFMLAVAFGSFMGAMIVRMVNEPKPTPPVTTKVVAVSTFHCQSVGSKIAVTLDGFKDKDGSWIINSPYGEGLRLSCEFRN